MATTERTAAIAVASGSDTSAARVVTRRPTRPDSVPSRLELVLLEETRRLGRAVAVAELYEPYASRFGPAQPNVLTNALSALCQRKRVLKVGGRIKQSRYAHVEHPVPFGESDDPAPRLLEAVKEGVEQLGHALSTGEVAERVRARGVTTLNIDQILNLLITLAHDADQKARRAHETWAGPSLRRIEEKKPSGKPALFWAPIGTSYMPPARPHARTDALRIAVQMSANALGRPVTRREVEWWLGAVTSANDSDVAAAAVSGGAPGRAAAHALRDADLRALMNRVRFNDVERASVSTVVRTVETPLSGRGACRPRFAVGDVAPAAHAACLLEDLAYLLTPADELDGIATLERLAADVRSPTLARLAGIRRVLLANAVASHVPATTSAADWVGAGARASRDAAATLAQWIDATTGARAEARLRAHMRLTTLDSQLSAFERGVTSYTGVGRGAPSTSARSILMEPGVPLVSLEGLVGEANALTQRQPQFWTAVLNGARRVRTPRSTVRAARTPEDARTFLDRPDALLLLARECHLPLLNALLASARLALGEVLRDAPMLTQLTTELAAHEHDARRALCMALALLGSVPEVETVWPEPSSAESAVLYVAAVCLAVDEAQERIRLLTAADRRARGGARRVTDQALMRAEAGDRLCVID